MVLNCCCYYCAACQPEDIIENFLNLKTISTENRGCNATTCTWFQSYAFYCSSAFNRPVKLTIIHCSAAFNYPAKNNNTQHINLDEIYFRSFDIYRWELFIDNLTNSHVHCVISRETAWESKPLVSLWHSLPSTPTSHQRSEIPCGIRDGKGFHRLS